MVNGQQVAREVRALASFQNFDVDRGSDKIWALLDDYAEIVLTEQGLELITGGQGEARARVLAECAREDRANEAVVSMFLECSQRFPNRPLGLKLCYGPNAQGPTLYVRSFCPLEEGLSFLDTWGYDTGELRDAIGSHEILYGLGFSTIRGKAVIKTYVIEDLAETPGESGEKSKPGFVSHRLSEGRLLEQRKDYWPEQPWSELSLPSQRWRDLADFASQTFCYQTANHVGLTYEQGREPELKIYVERIGAIPSDFSAR